MEVCTGEERNGCGLYKSREQGEEKLQRWIYALERKGIDVVCWESKEQVEEGLVRWRFTLERRGMDLMVCNKSREQGERNECVLW